MPSRRTPKLPEDVVRFAEAQVAAGRFASVEDVLRAGVQALQAREETEQEWLAYAREKWAERTAESERGQATTLTTDEFSDWLESCLRDATRH